MNCTHLQPLSTTLPAHMQAWNSPPLPCPSWCTWSPLPHHCWHVLMNSDLLAGTQIKHFCWHLPYQNVVTSGQGTPCSLQHSKCLTKVAREQSCGPGYSHSGLKHAAQECWTESLSTEVIQKWSQLTEASLHHSQILKALKTIKAKSYPKYNNIKD